MRRFIPLLMVLVWPLQAGATDVTADTVRNSILDGNDAEARAQVARVHADYLVGAATADEVREVFIALSRSHPAVVDFVATWVEEESDNPQAQIARAWSLWEASHRARRGGHYYGYEVAQDMLSEAEELATRAYLRDPTLIPASDAMIRNVRTGVDAPEPFRALRQVMRERPNWGSVLRALPSIRHWSPSRKRGFCEAVSKEFLTDQAFIEQRCLIDVAGRFGFGPLADEVGPDLWAHVDPEYELNRLRLFKNSSVFALANDEQLDWAQSVFRTFEPDQFELQMLLHQAQTFEHNMEAVHGKFVTTVRDVQLRNLERAKTYLERDPYNHFLIDFVEAAVSASEFVFIDNGDEGYRLEKRADAMSYEERFAFDLDLSERRLRGAPYEAKQWVKHANLLMHRSMPDTLFDGNDAMQNAVVYSTDPARELAALIAMQHYQYGTIRQFEMLPLSQRQTLPEYQRVVDNINMQEDILCPFERARLMYEMMCREYPSDAQQCFREALPEGEDYDALVRAARAAPACSGLRLMDIENEWYSPVDFDRAVVIETQSALPSSP